MKAFLSHSSQDKGIVDAVAKQLGRQFCRYDKFHFSTGEEFTDAIKRCLDESALFVLFASKNSLGKTWVKFEIEEAWHQKLRAEISKSLVYIIDSSIEVTDLPEWLQRALVRVDSAPKSISRDIRAQIDELLRSRRHPYFIGRANDMNRLEEILTPTDGSSAPRFFVINGLPGVGRRTLIRHTTANVLGFHKFIEIPLQEGDSINDICIKTADLAEPYSTQNEFVRIFKEIEYLSKEEAQARAIRNLRSLSEGGELPIIIDKGGLLDSEGYFRAQFCNILKMITAEDTAYLALVSHRRPQNQQNFSISNQGVNPLNEADTKRLVQRAFRKQEIVITPEQLADISEFVAGYPPSAFFAAQQAKDYGVELIIGHKHRLVEFRAGVFLKHIESLNLHSQQQKVLKLLASYSPLPLSVIMKALEISINIADETLTQLIDLSLVIPEGENLYSIAGPIKEATIKTFGFPQDKAVNRLVESLRSYLAEDLSLTRRLNLNRILFRAARLAGISDEEHEIRLAADLVDLTESFYHNREYKKAINCGLEAIDERPDSVNARSYLIRSYLQLELWSEAERQLAELLRYAPSRDVHFLRGFMERLKGNFNAAIDEYENAQKLGWKGVAISRELAQCYFHDGDPQTAGKYLKEALDRHGDNRYVVDLWVKIATEQKDQAQAQQALSRLEVIDKPEFYLYRKSRVELAFGNPSDARDSITAALQHHHKPPFHFYAQAVLCGLATNHLSEAEENLSILDSKFGGRRRDVRIGLRCRLLNKRGEYEDALATCERTENKDSRYYQSTKLDSLLSILRTKTLTEPERTKFQEEAEKLQEVLGPEPTFDLIDIE